MRRLVSFERFQALDRLTDGLVVRQHAAEPALIDVRHAARRLPSRSPCARRASSDEQHRAASATSLADELAAPCSAGTVSSRLMMWILLRAPKIRGHLRDSRNGSDGRNARRPQHLAHGDVCHGSSGVAPPRASRPPRRGGTPREPYGGREKAPCVCLVGRGLPLRRALYNIRPLRQKLESALRRLRSSSHR